MPASTANGKWILWDKDGQRFVLWSIDARSMIANGLLFHAPPDGKESGGVAPEQRGLVEGLDAPTVPGREEEQRSRAKAEEANAAALADEPETPPDAAATTKESEVKPSPKPRRKRAAPKRKRVPRKKG